MNIIEHKAPEYFFTTIISSCLVDVYRLKYLKKTILSIIQMFKNNCDEIIVLFDRVGIDKLHNVTKCITHTNGLGYSFNHGIEIAKNELVLQMEDDWSKNNNIGTIDHSFINNVYKLLTQKKGILKLYNDPVFNDYGKSVYGWIPGCDVMTDPVFHTELKKATDEQIKKYWWMSYRFNNAPHFKMKKFLHDVGRYPENQRPPIVEDKMSQQFNKSTYSVFYMTTFFQHCGGLSVRDISISTAQLAYEKIIVLGDNPIAGHIIKLCGQEEINNSPFQNTFVTLNFINNVFLDTRDTKLSFLQNIIKKSPGDHIIDSDNYMTFPDAQLKENREQFIDCFNKFIESLCNCSINFFYCMYPHTNSAIEIHKFTNILQNIRKKYNNDRIIITILKYDISDTSDTINHRWEKLTNDIHMVKITDKFEKNKTHFTNDWYSFIANNLDMHKKIIKSMYHAYDDRQ